MPKFYFHFRDGNQLYRDEDGQDFANLDLAREQAELHAKDILAEFMHDHHQVGDQHIEVTDAAGNVVTTVPIKIVMGFDWNDIESGRA